MRAIYAFGFIIGFGLFSVRAQEADSTVNEKSVKIEIEVIEEEEELKKIPFQITFFTPLGTNGWDYDKYETNLSINLIAGHNGGNNGIELGGFWNSDKRYARGLQLAGFGNSVFGNVEAVQGAGFINVVTKDFKGVQFAGFNNFVKGKVDGIQGAGFVNTTIGSLEGIQTAGFISVTKGGLKGGQVSGFGNVTIGDFVGVQGASFFNTTRGNFKGIQGAGFVSTTIEDFEGGQLAGFINVVRGSMNGVQAGGFGNVSLRDSRVLQGAGFLNVVGGDLNGGQAAGFINVAKGNMKGGQVAGFLNTAGKDAQGFQVSGFLNVAKRLQGIQVGIINVADSIDGGAQIGLLSFSRNGYSRFDLSSTETFYTQATLRLGMKKFYNVLAIGTRLENNLFLWAYGYGIGTAFEVHPKVDITLDGVAYHVNEGAGPTRVLNNLNKINLGAHYQFSKKFAVHAGATLNIHVSNMFDEDTQQFTSRAVPYTTYQEVIGNNNVQIYPGFKVGLSLL